MRLCLPPGRKRDREGGRVWSGGGRVRKMEEKRMDVLKHATAGKGERDMRWENDGPNAGRWT